MGAILDTIVKTVTPIRESIATTTSAIPGVNSVKTSLANAGITFRPVQRVQSMVSQATLGHRPLMDRLRGTFTVRGRRTQTLGPVTGLLHPELSSFKAIGYRR